MELISLIRSSKRSISRTIFVFIAFLFPLGNSLPYVGEDGLYSQLIKKVQEIREANYRGLLVEFQTIQAKIEGSLMKNEEEVQAKESEWRMLPQKLEEWRKEYSQSLFSLRLKELTALLRGKPAEAKELETELSTSFQSLLSQWRTPSIPSASPPTQKITPTPPPPPSPITGWWKSPQLLGTASPKRESTIETDFLNLSESLNRDIAKEKKEIRTKLGAFERSLEEVKRSCPLP